MILLCDTFLISTVVFFFIFFKDWRQQLICYIKIDFSFFIYYHLIFTHFRVSIYLLISNRIWILFVLLVFPYHTFGMLAFILKISWWLNSVYISLSLSYLLFVVFLYDQIFWHAIFCLILKLMMLKYWKHSKILKVYSLFNKGLTYLDILIPKKQFGRSKF